MTEHPLSDEVIEQNFAPEYGYVESDSILGVSEVCHGFSPHDLRAAYDMGYTQGLEDASDIVTCVQRKDSIAKPVTLEELEAMRPENNS